ncbi:type II toxin-antitoxin system PemK/MazF family toxin [Leptolyngbya sp. KIOST-1]|uniref:type II toxin-antitoxin system PemK/MazF family toxin n=1 Tax=Leptolyngbya sp. KIOST-1 TaxID=1229172 RepID=UPI000561CA1D|nr:type II toxin-antitoxin system PemK/MazF family toxin [Leptolyngbya sp. KIOST-1]
MIEEGQIILFPFPTTDQRPGKLRPALVLRQCPTQYEDWLICMISSQLVQQVPDIDEIILESDGDFGSSGLKQASVIRVSRLAVVNQAIFLGTTGKIADDRLVRLKQRFVSWILG